MGFRQYDEEIREKVAELTCSKLLRDIVLSDGVIERGTRIEKISLSEYDYHGKRCTLCLYPYKDGPICDINISENEIDNYFVKDDTLDKLDTDFKKIEQRIDQVGNCIGFLFIIFGVISILTAIMFFLSPLENSTWEDAANSCDTIQKYVSLLFSDEFGTIHFYAIVAFIIVMIPFILFSPYRSWRLAKKSRAIDEYLENEAMNK